MGAQESHLGAGLNPKNLKAYHVLRVAESSPAAEAGIEPFFDYIVGIGGQQVTEDGEKLANWLDEAEGKSITLQVYSSRKQEVRRILRVDQIGVRTLPSRKWPANNSPSTDQPLQPSLLGLSLRLCSPQNELANVWHVLDIVEGSPAQDAGLVPFGDWIIGYAGGILRSENELYEVVEEHEGRPLRLFVYNADYEVTREVVIVPNVSPHLDTFLDLNKIPHHHPQILIDRKRHLFLEFQQHSWGSGEGLLGCSIGFGLLHRIPKTSTNTIAPSFLLPPGGGNSSGKLEIDDDEDQKLLNQMGKITPIPLMMQEHKTFVSVNASVVFENTEFNQITENATASKDAPVNMNLRSHSTESAIREEDES
ncbi:hypothetical protein VP01_1739g2 [Puccinia sorghi]|uniref:PDZ GRASP-type domain-containing protein n=1 Tax=Puccinia sorghi TaxID=27349 RepID=A0A0L6VF93_9BASI|nr:hypothetical protein VP01_1739g2 [Puccinia sorghi]